VRQLPFPIALLRCGTLCVDTPFCASQLDDFYLNVVDWNQRNVLAVALNNAVYLWNATTGDNDKLVDLPEGQIASVSWCPRHKANILAVGTSGPDVQLWDVDRKMQIRNLRGHQDRVGPLLLCATYPLHDCLTSLHWLNRTTEGFGQWGHNHCQE